jgi:hypothetical protein
MRHHLRRLGKLKINLPTAFDSGGAGVQRFGKAGRRLLGEKFGGSKENLQENWRQDPGKPNTEAAPNPWRKGEVHRHDGCFIVAFATIQSERRIRQMSFWKNPVQAKRRA